jgi:hypothetical protein
MDALVILANKSGIHMEVALKEIMMVILIA